MKGDAENSPGYTQARKIIALLKNTTPLKKWRHSRKHRYLTQVFGRRVAVAECGLNCPEYVHLIKAAVAMCEELSKCTTYSLYSTGFPNVIAFGSLHIIKVSLVYTSTAIVSLNVAIYHPRDYSNKELLNE